MSTSIYWILPKLQLLWAKLLHVAHLATAIVTVHPDVPPGRAAHAAIHINIAADGEDEALLAEIAYGESGYIVTKVNGRYGACGPMQTLFDKKSRANQDRRCKPILADALKGYRAGVQKLRDAREHCHRHRQYDVLCDLAGFRSGPAGIYNRWYAKPREILARRDRLHDVVRELELQNQPLPRPTYDW